MNRKQGLHYELLNTVCVWHHKENDTVFIH